MRHIAIRSVWLIVLSLSLSAFAITRVVCIESVTLRNMMICDMSSDNDTSPAPSPHFGRTRGDIRAMQALVLYSGHVSRANRTHLCITHACMVRWWSILCGHIFVLLYFIYGMDIHQIFRFTKLGPMCAIHLFSKYCLRAQTIFYAKCYS